MKAALLALFAVCCLAGPASAQMPAFKPVVAPAPAAAPVLNPAQAQAVLDVLGNDAKRQQFIAVLQNMAKVQAAAAPKAAGIPLTPGSLGAELLTGASGAAARASTELLRSARTLTDVRLFRSWAARTLADPDSRARLIATGWRLAIAALAGGTAELLARRGIARWRDGLDRGVPLDDPADLAPDATPDPPVPDAAGPDADPEQSRVRPRRPTSWGLLKRLPYAVLRLAIDALPIAGFAALAYGVTTDAFGVAPLIRVLVLGLIDAYLLLRIVLALASMMLSPHTPSLRLVHLSDAAAAYLMRWARRFLTVAIFGFALDQAALPFGLYGTLHDALLRVVALLLHSFALIMVLQCRRKVARHLRAPQRAGASLSFLRNRLAETWHVIAIFFIVASWVVFAFEVRNGYVAMWRFFADAAVVLGVARLLSILLLGALDRALRLKPETVARYPGIDDRAGRYHPLLRGLLNTLLLSGAALVLLHIWGVPVNAWFRRGTLGGRLLDAFGTSGLVVLISVLVWEGVNALVQGHLARLARAAQLARSARLRTLLPMLRTTLFVVIFVFASLTVLSQIGVNTAPLLAGAGVVGIAIGFGSQKLVQDVITGLFLLLENTMQVGDWVALGGLAGTVETLSIRTIRLRALDGAVHIVPFSAVTTVTNNTRDYGYAVLDVTAGYNEEPDHIAAVLREVAEEMRGDARWGLAIDDDIDIQGVDRFMDNAWVLRARVKTSPTQRLPVQREFNRRLKYRFDRLAIESPFTSPRILSTVPGPAEPLADKAAP